MGELLGWAGKWSVLGRGMWIGVEWEVLGGGGLMFYFSYTVTKIKEKIAYPFLIQDFTNLTEERHSKSIAGPSELKYSSRTSDYYPTAWL